MATKKVLWGIVIFLLSLVVIYKICNIFITPVDPLDPLDAIYEYDDQEISVRKLFEASYEDLHYSAYWSVTGSYSDRAESYHSSPSAPGSSPYKILNKSINIKYDHYYKDEDNVLGILYGECIEPYYEFTCYGDLDEQGTISTYSYTEPYYFTCYGDLDEQSTISTYSYYVGIINGYKKTAYGYSGHEYSERFEVDKILMPNLDNLTDVSIYFDGSVDEQGHFIVTFVGNELPCIAPAFLGDGLRSLFNKAEYTFDAQTRKLVKVTLKYEDSHGGGNGPYSVESICLELTINDLAYGDYEIPEVPNMVCDNSILSGALTGEGTFKPSSFLNNDFSEENDFTGLIKCIWINTISSLPDECSLDEFSNKLSEMAALYGVDIKKDGYVLNRFEYSIYIKYVISVDDNEVANIIMPLIVYGAKLKNDNNLLIDINDELSVLEDGTVWIKHEDPDSVSFEKCYMIYTDGTLTLDHMMTKEPNVPKLLEDEEYEKFANWYDCSEIRAFAEEFESADKTYLARYYLFEDGYMNAYYTVKDYYYSSTLSTRFGIEFITQDEADQKHNAGRDEEECFWIRFD